MRQILVYPDAFVVHHDRPLGDGLVQVQRKTLYGESWAQGQVILSWAEVLAGAIDSTDGRNVVVHECSLTRSTRTAASLMVAHGGPTRRCVGAGQK